MTSTLKDEIAVSFFLIGRNNTLPLEIWSRLRRGMTPEINAISTIILVLSTSLILLRYRLRTHTQMREAEAAAVIQATFQAEEP